MTPEADRERRFDAIVVGGGHNGLVAAAYLGRAGLRVAVLEQREQLGGPCGTFEFLPGYRTAFTNSPGSLEPRIVGDLELASHGLRFVRPDPTLVHPFESTTFLGWRDHALVDHQLDRLAAGEAARYRGLIAFLEELGRRLGVSLFDAPPDLATLVSQLRTPEDEDAFGRLFLGTLEELLDDFLSSEESKALMAMLAVNGQLLPPSTPGSAIGLLLRPLSLASATRRHEGYDPRDAPLRGSVGLPVGGMGAIVDAVAADCRQHGVVLRTGTPVERILHDGDAVRGVVTGAGEEYEAPVVVASLAPQALATSLLDDCDDPMLVSLRRRRRRGSAFKIVLALDGLPAVRNLPEEVSPERALSAQFRIAPSLAYVEAAITDGLAGRPSRAPLIWGLVPSLTSPGVAPPGRHLVSLNIWHAPHDLADGDWHDERDRFGAHCVDLLDRWLPGLKDRIVDHRFIDPTEIAGELGLPASNITHGDMHPGRMFGFRPHVGAHDYRGPLHGLYLSGAGTWPGGYVTGIPGHNASRAVLADLAAGTGDRRMGALSWSS